MARRMENANLISPLMNLNNHLNIVQKVCEGDKIPTISQGQSDHTMFFKQSQDGLKTILIVYVDDIILTGDNLSKIRRINKFLAIEYEVRDLGQMRYFLGMQIASSRRVISIS